MTDFVVSSSSDGVLLREVSSRTLTPLHEIAAFNWRGPKEGVKLSEAVTRELSLGFRDTLLFSELVDLPSIRRLADSVRISELFSKTPLTPERRVAVSDSATVEATIVRNPAVSNREALTVQLDRKLTVP